MRKLDYSMPPDVAKCMSTMKVMPEYYKKATLYAINEMLRVLHNKMVSGIAKKVQIGKVENRIIAIKASNKLLKAYLFARLGGINAFRLGNAVQGKQGVTASGVHYLHAFINISKKSKNNIPSVFRRVGKDRYPLKFVHVNLNPAAHDLYGAFRDKEANAIFLEAYKKQLSKLTGVMFEKGDIPLSAFYAT